MTLSHAEAQELHELIGLAIEAQGDDRYDVSGLVRARELAAVIVSDTGSTTEARVTRTHEPSLVRAALDELLRRHPTLDVVSIDWQLPTGIELWSEGVPQRVWTGEMAGPWVLVALGQPSEAFEQSPAWARWQFAIWKPTGALYRVGVDGAVPDDPLWTPRGIPATT